MRSFEYRLYPSQGQRRRLVACLAETRVAYNAMLAYAKAEYERGRAFPGRFDLWSKTWGFGE